MARSTTSRVHPLSLVLTLFGGIERVMCDMAKPYPTRKTPQGERAVEVFDIATILMRLAGGGSGFIAVSRTAWGRKGRIAIQMFGSKGSILFDQERFNEFQLYLAGERPTEAGFRTVLAAPQHRPYDRFIPVPGHCLGFNDLKTIECRQLIGRIAGEDTVAVDLRGRDPDRARRRRHGALVQARTLGRPQLTVTVNCAWLAAAAIDRLSRAVLNRIRPDCRDWSFALKRLLAGALSLFALTFPALAADPDPAKWDAVLAEARGQTVYFNAWGGAENINAYVEWAGAEIERRYGVKLVHVKLDDTAGAVAKVVAEKSVGKDEGGSVDLIWINGENFAAMKQRQSAVVAGLGRKTAQLADMSRTGRRSAPISPIPVEGLESPWGMAKLVFFHDAARTDPASMPKSAAELLDWARKNPGRFTYPQPPDFIGSSFLKQVASELVADRSVLMKPVDEATFVTSTAPVFAYLDELNPLLWRGGKAYPQNYPAMKQLLADDEVDIIFAFNPSEASAAIAAGELPDTVRSFTFPGGTLSNTHFVAIPYNAAAKAGALVLADFLISPEAQAHKQDPKVWGDPTVLDLARLSPAGQSAFRRARPRRGDAEAGRARPGARRAASELDGAAGDGVEATVRGGELRRRAFGEGLRDEHRLESSLRLAPC